jgi:hypothetical protein
VIAIWTLLGAAGSALLLRLALATVNGHRYLSWARTRADELADVLWEQAMRAQLAVQHRADARRRRRERSQARGARRSARQLGGAR